LSQPELLGSPQNLFLPLESLALIGDEQLGVTNNVDEQGMPDLEFHV
jgi:hypothetical protein